MNRETLEQFANAIGIDLATFEFGIYLLQSIGSHLTESEQMKLSQNAGAFFEYIDSGDGRTNIRLLVSGFLDKLEGKTNVR